MSSVIVQAQGLCHRYGSPWVIRDIDFEIAQHGIVGLLGSNGAGKSTTMNILCGVLKPTQGRVLIEGVDMSAQPEAAKRRLGFLPQNPPLYLDFTVDEYLLHCAHLRLIARPHIPEALAAAKERCGVTHVSRRLIGNLSGGYRQRVGIAQAIIHRPKLVVLDEPTNGLDPNQIIEVRALIKEIAEERAVLFSTHILSEVRATCRHIIMIEKGQVVFSDSVEAFDGYLQPHSILLSMAQVPSPEQLQAIPGIIAVEVLNAQTVRLRFDGSPDITERLIARSVAEGWRLQEISLEKTSLESVFKHLSSEAAAGQPR